MMKDNPILDDLAKLASGAAGGLLEVKREVEAMVRTQVEKMLLKSNLITRDEFEAVRAMAAKNAEKVAALEARLEALEKHK